MQSQTINAVLEQDKDGTWYYVHVPKDVRSVYKEYERRGAIAVIATAGSSTWQASILPWADGSGQISVNKKVREKEGFLLGQLISLVVTPRIRD